MTAPLPPAPPWTIRIDAHPPGPNERLHSVERWRRCQPLHDAVAWQARALVRALGLPAPLESVRIAATVVYSRRPFRDPDNAVASLKCLLDGLVAGGLLADDGPTHVELAPLVQELGPHRAVVLTITPLHAAPARHQRAPAPSTSPGGRRVGVVGMARRAVSPQTRTGEPFLVIAPAGLRWEVDFGGRTFAAVTTAFKEAFPHTEGRLWLPHRRRWSVPPGSYARLLAFAHTHYRPEQITVPPVLPLGPVTMSPDQRSAVQRLVAALLDPEDSAPPRGTDETP